MFAAPALADYPKSSDIQFSQSNYDVYELANGNDVTVRITVTINDLDLDSDERYRVHINTDQRTALRDEDGYGQRDYVAYWERDNRYLEFTSADNGATAQKYFDVTVHSNTVDDAATEYFVVEMRGYWKGYKSFLFGNWHYHEFKNTKQSNVTIYDGRAPAVDFSADKVSGYEPLTVKFTDLSTNSPTSWNWNFGDGTTSTLQNPAHTYATSGVYTVTLTATNPAGSGTKTKTNYITVNVLPAAPDAGTITADPVSGYVPLTVDFSSDSTGTGLTYYWDFGDGSTSTEANPTHQYTNPGTYTVTLTVTDSFGRQDTITITVTVNPLPTAPVAAFTADVTTGYVPLTVHFTDASTGTGLAYSWNFGDGSAVSTERNPTHEYTVSGTYTVTLTVTDVAGQTDTATIGVTANALPAAPVAGTIVADPASGYVPLTVDFSSIDTTGTELTYSWSFGDGISANGETTSHEYTAPGTYTVTLTVTDVAGQMSSTTTTVQVNELPVVKFGSAAYEVAEAAGTASLALTLSSPAGSDLAIYYETADGTAINGTDYTGAASYVTIPAGSSSATITVPIIDDGAAGGDVNFMVNLLSGTGYGVGEPSSATVTIIDDETTFTIHLKEGWNMISSPLVIEPFNASKITDKCLAISQVMQYDTTKGSFSAYLMGISTPKYDFPIQTDVGYLVYADENADLTFIGKRPVDRVITLNPGWTMAGWSTMASSDANTVTGMLVPDDQQIMMYNTTQTSFVAYLEGISTAKYNFAMVPGGGYLIYTDSQTTLNFGGL